MILSLGAPLFMLLSTGLYPNHLSTDHFILAWLLSALALLALVLLAVQPAGAGVGPSAGSGGLQPGTPNGSVAVLAVAGGSPLAPAAPGGSSPLAAAAGSGAGGRWWARAWPALTGCSGSRIRHLCAARRPRRNGVLAVLASVQCMLWLSVAADELVSLFEVGCGAEGRHLLPLLSPCMHKDALIHLAWPCALAAATWFCTAGGLYPFCPRPAVPPACPPLPSPTMRPHPPAHLQSIGRICDISQDLLGATVLAWGEAVPELVATMSLARQGQATTAIAAVFGVSPPCTAGCGCRSPQAQLLLAPGLCWLLAGPPRWRAAAAHMA